MLCLEGYILFRKRHEAAAAARFQRAFFPPPAGAAANTRSISSPTFPIGISFASSGFVSVRCTKTTFFCGTTRITCGPTPSAANEPSGRCVSGRN